jgi:hypothetical protein
MNDELQQLADFGLKFVFGHGASASVVRAPRDSRRGVI